MEHTLANSPTHLSSLPPKTNTHDIFRDYRWLNSSASLLELELHSYLPTRSAAEAAPSIEVFDSPLDSLPDTQVVEDPYHGASEAEEAPSFVRSFDHPLRYGPSFGSEPCEACPLCALTKAAGLSGNFHPDPGIIELRTDQAKEDDNDIVLMTRATLRELCGCSCNKMFGAASTALREIDYSKRGFKAVISHSPSASASHVSTPVPGKASRSTWPSSTLKRQKGTSPLCLDLD